MDEATAELIYRLQLEDLEEAKQMSKGKGKENESIPDAELALQLQQEELEREARVRADRRMAASIGRAVQDDGANIAIMAGEESRATGDRAMACRLGGQTAQPHPQMRVLDVDDDILSRLDAFSIDDTANDDSSAPSPTGSEAGESSAWAAGRRLGPPSDLKRQCVSCLETKHGIQYSETNRFSPFAVAAKTSSCLLYTITWAPISHAGWKRRPLSMAPPIGPTAIQPHAPLSSILATSADRQELAPSNIARARRAFYARELPMMETARREMMGLNKHVSWLRRTDGSNVSSAVVAINSVICVEPDGRLVDASTSIQIGYSNEHSKSLIDLSLGAHPLPSRPIGRKESTRSQGTSATAMTVSTGAIGERLTGGSNAKSVATGCMHSFWSAPTAC
ncbi:MAG: hypothetical protein Q9207_005942 [Kuettlingeria erythrocarpa]